ncbi:MAG: TadE/TadG family type IV pilus assembly protein [Terracidiphilus sp.]
MTGRKNSNRPALLDALRPMCGRVHSIVEWTGIPSAYRTLSSRFREFCGRREGNALVEFAAVAPLLICLLMGLVAIGVLVNNYITLTDAVAMGARAFAEATGVTSSPVNSDPCAYAVSVMDADAKSLATANITYTITYTPASTGTPATLSSSCTGSTFTGMKEGDTVSITATYPALMIYTTYKGGVLILPHYTSSWTLSAHTTQVVQ